MGDEVTARSVPGHHRVKWSKRRTERLPSGEEKRHSSAEVVRRRAVKTKDDFGMHHHVERLSSNDGVHEDVELVQASDRAADSVPKRKQEGTGRERLLSTRQLLWVLLSRRCVMRGSEVIRLDLEQGAKQKSRSHVSAAILSRRLRGLTRKLSVPRSCSKMILPKKPRTERCSWKVTLARRAMKRRKVCHLMLLRLRAALRACSGQKVEAVKPHPSRRTGLC